MEATIFDEHRAALESLPERLHTRARKVEDAPSVERRHSEALRLMQDVVLELGSRAFADYRRTRADAPDEQVERVLLKFKRPWTEDYCELLRASLSAVPPERRLLAPGAVKLRGGAVLKRAIAAVERAMASRARDVGPLLDAELADGGRAALPLYELLNVLVRYRNCALAHTDRTNWTDLQDFYDRLTPLVERVAVELACHPEVVRALAERTVGTLLETVADDGAGHLHRCRIAAGPVTVTAAIVAAEAATATWRDPRWAATVGGSLLVDRADPDAPRILGPFHDFGAGDAPPAPLAWPEAMDRHTAIVRTVLRETHAGGPPGPIAPEEQDRRVSSALIAQRLDVDERVVQDHLVELGSVLVQQGGAAAAASDLVELRPDVGYVLAVELGHERLGLAFGDLAGRTVGERRERDVYRTMLDDPAAVFAFVADAAERTRAALEIPAQDVCSVVVGVAAPVRQGTGGRADWVLPGTGMPPAWDELAPAAEIQRLLTRRVGWAPAAALCNDANLAALAETRWGTGRGVPTVVYVEWSEGIGGGLILDGELYAGAHGAAAEFGHHQMAGASPGPCSCGHRNCLESLASTTAMVREANEQLGGGGPLTFADFWERVRAGDRACSHVATVAAHRLGTALAPIVGAVDPQRIVIGGYFAGDALDLEIVRGPLTSGIAARRAAGYVAPEITMGTLGASAVLQGAVTHGLERHAPNHVIAVAQRALIERAPARAAAAAAAVQAG